MAKRRTGRAQPDAVSTASSAPPVGPASPPLSAPAAAHGATPATPAPTEQQTERLRRRAAFLRDLADAKELRARVRPRRTRVARLREALRRATYRN